MQPSSPPPRYTTLTYKSAASSARATSALAPTLHPAPFSQRSSTSLSSTPRTMSLSCIPPSAAYQTDHVCPRCVAPPPASHSRRSQRLIEQDARRRMPLTYKAVAARHRAAVQSRSESVSSMEKKMSKIVVRRRLVRGSSVVRGATEAEIEEMLGGERYREMVRCVEAGVDIAPGVEAKKKGRRGSVGREEGWLDVRELAMLDEGVAVGVFLKEMRKWRKERGRRKGKKGVERSLSADDPELMRALMRQEEVLSRVRKKVEEERSRSELGGGELDERWRRFVGKEEEEDCAQLGRILTAIEPVDPSGGEVSRGTSYHGGGGKKKGWRLRRLKSWRKQEWFG